MKGYWYCVESVGNGTGGCYYNNLAYAKKVARRRIRHENAREAVVVDTECNDEYGVVIYIVKPDPIVEIFEMEVNIPYPEWRKSADVPPEDPAPAPAGPMGATERAV